MRYGIDKKIYTDGKFICKPRIDLTNQTFGELTVVERASDLISPTNKRRFTAWLCKCSCGNEKIATTYELLRGSITTCGDSKHKRTYNQYDLSGEYGICYTRNIDPTDKNNKRNYFYFDLEDYDLIKEYTWYFEGRTGYVVNRRDHKTIRLHRLVMKIEDPKLCVDHISHNRFDNRKINLRLATYSTNQMNRYSKPKSGYRGVYWDNDRRKWTAYIKTNGSNKRLGRYNNIEDAAKARKEAEEKYYGEYSYNNSMKYAIDMNIL